MSEPFTASRVGRHLACPASAHLELAIPGWTPPVRDDMAGAKGVGTTLHSLLEPIVGLPNSQMQLAVKALAYIAEVRSTRRFNVMVEQKMVADWLPSKPSTTADIVLYLADELHIIDTKFGKIPVEVIGNKQLMYYALTYAHLAPKAREVHLHIVQPAIDNMEVWVVDAKTLAQFQADCIAADNAIISGDTTFGPSDDCTFCPAYPHSRGDKGKPLCPATMAMLYPPVVHEDEILGL